MTFFKIHANWPVFPLDFGWETALETLGNFPEKLWLYEIDNIDECRLFVFENPQKYKDPFDKWCFHIAIFDEDLLILKEKGLIKGVYTEDEFELEYKLDEFKRFKERLIAQKTKFEEDILGNLLLGKQSIIEKPKKDKQYNEEVDELYGLAPRRVAIPGGRIRLTERGINLLQERSEQFKLDETINNKISPLLEINYFDTAVREAAILTEHKLKQIHNLTHRRDLYGEKLIKHHIKKLIEENNGRETIEINCHSVELRTLFKFIRNDFMHNLKILSRKQCLTLLNRISRTYKKISDMERESIS